METNEPLTPEQIAFMGVMLRVAADEKAGRFCVSTAEMVSSNLNGVYTVESVRRTGDSLVKLGLVRMDGKNYVPAEGATRTVGHEGEFLSFLRANAGLSDLPGAPVSDVTLEETLGWTLEDVHAAARGCRNVVDIHKGCFGPFEFYTLKD